MSITSTRQELADALTTVDGVNGFKYQPKAPRSGDGWPRLASMARDAGQSFEVTWGVVVIGPTDQAAFSDFLESKMYDLFDALEPVGFIDSFEPITLTAEGSNNMNAILITLRAED